MKRALVVLACALSSATALGDEPPPAIWAPRPPQKLLSPDARRFLAPSLFAYWAGAERVADSELSLATPRPLEGRGFLPAFDDHLSTTSYLSVSSSHVRHRDASWSALELSSIHDLRGGAVLGVSFRVDAREQTAIDGSATLALPLPERLWLVSTIGAGAYAAFAPEFLAGAELRSDRTHPLGYTLGIEASRWTYDRTRVMAKAGAVYRVTAVVALEQHVAIGAWTGPRVGGDVAVRWVWGALQTLGERAAMYERATLARGPAAAVAGAPPDHSELSADLAVGYRHTIASSYGISVEVDEGGQQATYQRWGAQLTLYGVLF